MKMKALYVNHNDETFIYNYNKGKTCLEEMCCYAYQLLTVERI